MSLYQQVMKDSPAVYWQFQESVDGASCADSSGNGRNGVEQGTGASLASTGIVPGHHYSYVNVGDGYWASNANATDTNLDVGTGDFTVEFWLKINNSTANYTELMSRDAGATGNGLLLLANITTGGPRFWCGGTVLNGPTRLNDDRLHHVVARRIAGTAAVLVDGVSDVSGAAAGSTDVANRPLRCGVNAGLYPRPLGRFAHFAYYKTGLSDARVRVHYEAGIRGGVVY